MEPERPSPEDLFALLVAHFGAPQESTPAKGFGSGALKVDGKIFAALTKGELIVKLPKERVDALERSGAGRRLSMGGRPKKEWMMVPPDNAAQWLALAEEARAFVGFQAKPSVRSSSFEKHSQAPAGRITVFLTDV